MRSRIYILGCVFLIILVAVGSCRKAGSYLLKDDQVEHADVMVLLTGTLTDRVLQTADLYHEGVASRVWIVEAGRGADSILKQRGVYLKSYSQQNRDVLIQLGIPADRIELLPGGATSTRMEALIIRDHLQTQKGIETLLLVTSSEHTRRAHKIFEAAFHPLRKSSGRAPVVSCSPSKYTNFHAEKWWRSRDDIQDLVNEYLKLLNFALFEKRELKKEQ